MVMINTNKASLITLAVQGEIAKDLLRTGRHVFMEKPMAVSVSQAEAIVEASKAPEATIPGRDQFSP